MKDKDFTLANLYDLILDIMQLEQVTPIIKKQINRYILELGMTPLEIARCLTWYIDVEHGELKPQYGVAVVPNIREASAKYWQELIANAKKQEIEGKKVVTYQNNNILFNLKDVTFKRRKPKQLDIGSIVLDEEEDK